MAAGSLVDVRAKQRYNTSMLNKTESKNMYNVAMLNDGDEGEFSCNVFATAEEAQRYIDDNELCDIWADVQIIETSLAR
jgi:hypothetical protein